MDWHEHIERNPQILGGKPVIKGTRLSVEFILERLGQGAPVDDLLKAHPQLRTEHIWAAQSFAAALYSVQFFVISVLFAIIL